MYLPLPRVTLLNTKEAISRIKKFFTRVFVLIYVRKHGPKLTLLKLIQDMENAPEKSEVKAAHLSTQRWMGARDNTKARTFQEQNAKFVITNISMILQAVVSSFKLCP